MGQDRRNGVATDAGDPALAREHELDAMERAERELERFALEVYAAVLAGLAAAFVFTMAVLYGGLAALIHFDV